MRSIAKFRELKQRVIDELEKMINCYFVALETAKGYSMISRVNDEYSYIEFNKKKLTEVDIGVVLKDLRYYYIVELPSDKMARLFLREVFMVETCDEYLSLFEELLSQPPKTEVVIETLYKDDQNKLERYIYGNGNVILKHEHYEHASFIIHQVHASIEHKKLIHMTIIDFDTVERNNVILKDAPKAFESVVDYMLNASHPNDYLRLNKAVEELIRLVNVKGYKVKDVIRELVEKHGYYDIFGQYLNRF